MYIPLKFGDRKCTNNFLIHKVFHNLVAVFPYPATFYALLKGKPYIINLTSLS